MVLTAVNGMDPLRIEWRVTVPIFKNNVILKQLGVAIGIPFGLVIMILAATSGGSIYTLYALGMIALLFFFTWLLIKVIYRGNYEAEFELDEKGVLCRTQDAQRKKNRILNGLTVVMGFLAQKPVVAGAGMLADSRQEEFIKWSQVKKVKCDPRQHTILLYGGWAQNVALFCTADNYDQVTRIVENFISAKEN